MAGKPPAEVDAADPVDDEPTAEAPKKPAKGKQLVTLHRGNETHEVEKPSAEYTTLTLSYGWKEA